VVVGNQRHGGADHLVIRQPDQTLALLPGWMIEAEAGSYTLRLHPRLPLTTLSALHALVGALVTSGLGDSPPARGDGDAQRARQSEGPLQDATPAARASARGKDISNNKRIAVWLPCV
jgi:hypothetical protein